MYPAGFVYFFELLRLLTDEGENIYKAQLIFAAFNVITSGLCVYLYYRSNAVPR